MPLISFLHYTTMLGFNDDRKNYNPEIEMVQPIIYSDFLEFDQSDCKKSVYLIDFLLPIPSQVYNLLS